MTESIEVSVVGDKGNTGWVQSFDDLFEISAHCDLTWLSLDAREEHLTFSVELKTVIANTAGRAGIDQ